MAFVGKVLVGVADSKMKPNFQSEIEGHGFVPVGQSMFGFLPDLC